MRSCFSGSVKELHSAVKQLLSVDSSEAAKLTADNSVLSYPDDTFSCVELSALESLRDTKQHTVAHIAAAGANIDILQFLLTSMPALAHCHDDNGENPLFYAIRAAAGRGELDKAGANFISCALLLLGHTGPNIISNSGASALHVAAELGALEVCRFLVSNNADVNIFSDNYGTPLTVAVIRGYVDIVEFLLSQGANPDGVPYGDVSLQECSACRFPPPLVFACSSGQTKIFDLLLSFGARVNVRDCEGWTPLHCAAEVGMVDLVRRLVELNADCNVKTQGKTAYHLAVWNGHGEVVDILRDLTVDKEPIDRPEPESAAAEAQSDEEVCVEEFHGSADELELLVNRLREEGRVSVSQKDYENACMLYSRAIAYLRRAGESHKTALSVFYSNRSHTYMMLNKLDKARRDAEACIASNPSWPKGYFRLASVDKACNQETDYLYNLFQAYSRDPNDASMRKLFQEEFMRAKKGASKI